MSKSRSELTRFAVACAIGVMLAAYAWQRADAVEPQSVGVGQSHASTPLANEADVRGRPPSAEALKLGKSLLEPHLSPRIEAELPDLAEPQASRWAPPAPHGDDFELWPDRKWVPAPTPDDPLLDRLRSPFH